MATTQKDIVRQLLIERGDQGVSAQELIYNHGITRAAAHIFDLRRDEQLPIETVTEPGKTAVYYLRKRQPLKEKPQVPGQDTLFSEAELPTVTWEEVGAKLRPGAH